jgi:hypothetical protein
MSEQASPDSKTADKFVVRLPKGMRKQIFDAARYSRRSMNSEIVARLEWTLNGESFPARHETQLPDSEPADDPPHIDSLTELELRLVGCFRQLPQIKRRALIDMLS